MKTLLVVTAVLLAVWGFQAGQAFAKEDANQPAGPKGRHGKALEEVIKELQLTQKQEAQVRQIMETHRKEVANWSKENQAKLEELQQQIKAARDASDTQKQKALAEKRAELFKSRMEITDKTMKQLGEVLKEEQMAKVKAAMERGGRAGAGRMHGAAGTRPVRPEWGRRPGLAPMHGAFESLNLTEDQQAKVKEILEQAGKEARAVMEAAWKKIAEQVLTDQQGKQLEQLGKEQAAKRMDAFLARLKKLGLTAEQQQKVDQIMAEARANAEKAQGPEAKRQVFREAFGKIRDEVLTENQREQLKKEPGPWRAGRPAAGPWGRGRAPAPRAGHR
jgi:Spy/CpxP family protein refolding chaperone